MGGGAELQKNAWIVAKDMFFRFFRQDAEDFRLLIYFALSQGILSLGLPLGVQILINRILATAMIGQAVWIVIWVGIGLIASEFFKIGQRLLVERLQRRFHSRVVIAASQEDPNRLDADVKINHRYFDAFIVQKTLSSLSVEGLASVLKLGAALLLLAFYHPFFLVFDLVVIFLIYTLLRATFHDALSSAYAESSAKHAVAIEFQKKDRASDFEPLCIDYLETRASHFKILLKQIYGLALIHIVGSIILLGVGAWLVIKEQMSLGQLVAAELVFSLAFSALEKMNKHLEDFFDMISALIKIDPIVSVADGETE